MPSVSVSLGAEFIPSGQKIFKCFPGSSYHLGDVMLEQNCVFLDMNNLQELDGFPTAWNPEKILEKICLERFKIEDERHQKGLRKSASNKINRTDRRNLTFLDGLINKAQLNDLVVVPTQGYWGALHIGRLTGGIDDSKLVQVAVGEDVRNFIARPVKWVHKIQKSKLSEDMFGQLHNQTAFHLLKKSCFGEIFESVYGSYVFNDQCLGSFLTRKQNFSFHNNMDVAQWFDLINRHCVDAYVQYVSEGRGPFIDLDSRELIDFSVQINSPGRFALLSQTFVPMVFISLMGIANIDDERMGIEAPRVITHLQNSGVDVPSDSDDDVQDDCEKMISELTQRTMSAMGGETWAAFCELTRTKVVEEATLHADVEAELIDSGGGGEETEQTEPDKDIDREVAGQE